MRVEEVCMRTIRVIIFVLGVAVVLCGSTATADVINGGFELGAQLVPSTGIDDGIRALAPGWSYVGAAGPYFPNGPFLPPGLAAAVESEYCARFPGTKPGARVRFLGADGRRLLRLAVEHG